MSALQRKPSPDALRAESQRVTALKALVALRLDPGIKLDPWHMPVDDLRRVASAIKAHPLATEDVILAAAVGDGADFDATRRTLDQLRELEATYRDNPDELVRASVQLMVDAHGRHVANDIGVLMRNPDPTDPEWIAGAQACIDNAKALMGCGEAGGAEGAPAHRWIPAPIDDLPEPWRTYVAESAQATGCDPAMIATLMFATIGAAIGTTRRVRLMRRWFETPIVWSCVVCKSGMKKSPAFDAAACFTTERQDVAFDDHKIAMEQYAAALAKYRRDARAFETGRSDCAEPPTEPRRPVAMRLTTSDATIEKVGALLVDTPRLVVLSEELASWLDFARYGKGASVAAAAARWLVLFNARTLIQDRVQGGTLYVPWAGASVTGTTQPATIRAMMQPEHRSNGLFARLLYCRPPRRRSVQLTDFDIGEATIARMRTVACRLFALQHDIDDAGKLRPHELALSADAKAEFDAFQLESGEEQDAMIDRDEDDTLEASWPKLRAYAARFAIIFHLVRCAAEDPTVASQDVIDASSMAAGVSWSRWFGNEARRLHATLDETSKDRRRRALVEWLERKAEPVTPSDLATSGPRWFRGRPDDAEAALRDLVKDEIVREVEGGKRGRPTMRFQLVVGIQNSAVPQGNGGLDSTGSPESLSSGNPAGDGDWGEA